MNNERLALGTVQLGMDYGITNRSGQIPGEIASKILTRYLSSTDSPLLDTASGYGRSEEIIGRHLVAHQTDTQPHIVTKLKATDGDIHKEFKASLKALGVDHVYGLLLHDLTCLQGSEAKKIISDLSALKKGGYVKKIGASIYTQDQAEKILEINDFDLVQLPYSILDQRLSISGTLKTLKEHNFEIHARSVFLQGLILANIEEVPPRLAELVQYIQKIDNIAQQLGISRLELALAFVLAQPEINRLVVGVAGFSELEAILNAAQTSLTLNKSEFNFGSIPSSLLDPRYWK